MRMCAKPAAQVKEFYLTIVRHGQTLANIKRTIQGHSDTPLSELGLGQAKALARHFKDSGAKRFDRVYSSDLSRASETCNIILNGFSDCSKVPNGQQSATNEPRPPVNVVLDSRLRERRYGPYEGKGISQLQQEAIELGYNLNNFTQYTPNGVETVEQVKRRVSEFCRETLFPEAQDGEEILMVSHWAVIMQFLKLSQPKSQGSIRDEHLIETPNTGMSRLKMRCQLMEDPIGERIDNEHTQQNQHERLEWSIIDLQVIYLHQTPHLHAEQRSANLKQQLA